jgi:hypothetical protein
MDKRKRRKKMTYENRIDLREVHTKEHKHKRTRGRGQRMRL